MAVPLPAPRLLRAGALSAHAERLLCRRVFSAKRAPAFSMH